MNPHSPDSPYAQSAGHARLEALALCTRGVLQPITLTGANLLSLPYDEGRQYILSPAVRKALASEVGSSPEKHVVCLVGGCTPSSKTTASKSIETTEGLKTYSISIEVPAVYPTFSIPLARYHRKQSSTLLKFSFNPHKIAQAVHDEELAIADRLSRAKQTRDGRAHKAQKRGRPAASTLAIDKSLLDELEALGI